MVALPSFVRSWIRRPRSDTLNLDDVDPEAPSCTDTRLLLFFPRKISRRTLTAVTLLVILSLCGVTANAYRARIRHRPEWFGEPFYPTDAIWDLLPRVHIDNTFGAVLLGTFIGLTSVSSSS